MFGGHLNRRSFWRLPPKSQSTPLLADNHTRLDNSYLLSDNKCNGTGQTKESSGRQAGRAHHAPFDERRAQGPLRCCQESGPVHFQVRKKTDREVTTMENEEKKPRGEARAGLPVPREQFSKLARQVFRGRPDFSGVSKH